MLLVNVMFPEDMIPGMAPALGDVASALQAGFVMLAWLGLAIGLVAALSAWKLKAMEGMFPYPFTKTMPFLISVEILSIKLRSSIHPVILLAGTLNISASSAKGILGLVLNNSGSCRKTAAR